MRPCSFKPSDPISFLAILYNLNTACNINGIYEGSAMCLFPHRMIEPAKATFSYRMSAAEDNDVHRKETFTTYCLVVKNLLEINETDGFIAGTEADTMSYKQSENMFAVCYSNTLSEKALR